MRLIPAFWDDDDGLRPTDEEKDRLAAEIDDARAEEALDEWKNRHE